MAEDLNPAPNSINVAVSCPGLPATNKTSPVILDNPPLFTYDSAGNMTSDGKNHYAWNDEDRLASVTPVFPRQGDLKLTYTYDHQGRRVYTDRFTYDGNSGAWAAASRTFYQYQGWNVVGSTLLNFGSGGFTTPAGSTTYAWGVDLSGSLQGAGGVGGLLAMRDGAGALAEYHYDFNGNVVGLADPASPQLLAEYTYDPFGKRLSATGPLAPANPFCFSTKIEEETGWNYYGYRFYAPEIGRWPNRDPIEEGGGVNLYILLGNTIANTIDLLGLSDLVNIIWHYKMFEESIQKTARTIKRLDAGHEDCEVVKAKSAFASLYIMYMQNRYLFIQIREFDSRAYTLTDMMQNDLARLKATENGLIDLFNEVRTSSPYDAIYEMVGYDGWTLSLLGIPSGK